MNNQDHCNSTIFILIHAGEFHAEQTAIRLSITSWSWIHNNLSRNYTSKVANSQYRFLVLLLEKPRLRVTSSFFDCSAVPIRLNPIVFPSIPHQVISEEGIHNSYHY